RGAASAVYGSDALAGVINIVTRRPATGYRESLSVELGEDDYQQFSVSALGREGVFDYTVEIATRDDGEPVPGSARDSDSANLRLGWQPDERHDLTFNFRYLEGDRSSYPEQSGGPEFAAIDALDEAHYEDQVLGITWDLQVSPGWRSRLSLTRFDHEEDYTSPGIVPFDAVPPNAAATDFTRDQLQWVNSIEPAPGYRLDVGADYRDEQGDSSGYLEFSGNRLATDFELDRDVAGAFAALSARPLDGLLLNGGVRYDDPDGFDGEVSWSVGAKVEAGAGFTLSANLAEAFKLPSFFALGNALVGNPALQPEYSVSWDAGVAWRGGSGMLLAATWFANEFEDLVDFDSTLFKNVNRGRVETSGVELEALLPLAADLALRANGTWTDIDVGGQDTVLTGRPEWSAGMVADWRLSPAWQLALDYRFSGRQWAASRYTGAEQTLKLDAYHRVDSVLHWTPTARWRLQLSVDNLLDENYETAVGFPAPGRGVRVGITFSP
ncbi:MAG: TonB-dependent receptor, partial [Halioglobus sp.]|nr:TonB-dependent receptor [Halioglobus sp.]